MTTARVFAVENKLAKIAAKPGGKTIHEAISSAERKVESVREACVGALAGKVADLIAHAAAAKADQSHARFDGLYKGGNAIYGVAGAFGLTGLAQAASSLCDLIEGFRNGEPVNWPAIDVHVDGIRLLVSGGEAGAEPILAGLRAVRARFVPQP
jgi:hypothetical protein